MKTIAIAAAAILAGFAAIPALAEEVRIEVSYTDLNIDTHEGASRLAERIASTVKSACAANVSRDLKTAAMTTTCQNNMMAEAASQLNERGARLAAESLVVKG